MACEGGVVEGGNKKYGYRLVGGDQKSLKKMRSGSFKGCAESGPGYSGSVSET